MTVRVELAAGDRLGAPVRLLEKSLREGDPLPETFVVQLRRAIEEADIEVLAAYEDDRAVGVVVLASRLSFSAGDLFASVEELYVSPGARRSGVGTALLEEAGRRCEARGISYVEVQTVDEAAESFYATLGFDREEGVRVMSRSYAL